MQEAIAEPNISEGCWVEVRAQWRLLPPGAGEIEKMGLHLLEQSRLLRIEGAEKLEPHHLAALHDPLTETVLVTHSSENAGSLPGRSVAPSPARPPSDIPGSDTDLEWVDVFCKPGVTDAEGEMATLALAVAGLHNVRCAAGLRYRFAESVPHELRAAVERLLGNPLIHQFVWKTLTPQLPFQPGGYPLAVASGWRRGGLSREDSPLPSSRAGTLWVSPAGGGARGEGPSVQPIDILYKDDETLLAVSGRYALALDLAEMRAIADHFERLGRAPTDVELQSIALTWSEHCSHKTFKATIDFEHDGVHETIPSLIRTYLAEPTRVLNKPWVRSAFVDNAGVIAFDRRHDLAIKVETHNHPSALEPYGGAHTGVGGVIRDVLAVSAEPIANTDVLCFGPPDLPDESMPAGAFHPRRTFHEVVRGIGDYGNNMGVPTVGGAVLFHPGYAANPLVYCGTVGIAPRDGHPRRPEAGDAVVLLGGRTGRDGLNGATMSSATLDRAGVEGSTVQIGNPITEKVMRDVLPRLRDERLYHAITDCGAGGLCSAVGEMGEDLGVEVDLALVSLKYEGLRPWEIWLSEAQERMVLAVPPNSLPRIFELCRAHGTEATVIGTFTGRGSLALRYGTEAVADIEMAFLHGGRPERVLEARWTAEHSGVSALGDEPETEEPADNSGSKQAPAAQAEMPDIAASLLRLLAHPNIASKEDVIRRYDHEVQGRTIGKPLTERGGPSDAAVLRPNPSSWRGAVVAHGINPLYGEIDPHAMAMLAVDEALRNLVAAGGSITRTALLDNFCWGDVDNPEALGGLVRAAQGCRDAALSYGVPFISGKDSLRNTSADAGGRHSIPGTLLITALGVIPDLRKTVTMDLKAPWTGIYVLGMTGDEMGGSHHRWIEGIAGGTVPRLRPEETVAIMKRLTSAIRTGLVCSCHDLSEGGLAVAAAEMALAGALGLELDLAGIPSKTSKLEALLFSESPGRFLVEVEAAHASEFERLFKDLPRTRIGQVTPEPRFLIRQAGDTVIDLPLEEIDGAWRGRSPLPLTPSPLEGEEETFEAGFALGKREASSAGIPSRALLYKGDSSLPLRERGWGRGVALILTAPGVNCDGETVVACRMAGLDARPVHLNELLDGSRRLVDAGFLVLPGGFSYGDHLGAGSMLATMLHHRLLDDLKRFIEDGRLVLGICNGFQALARLGVFGSISLAPNSTGRFECRWMPLRVEPSPCVFLAGLESLELPIAHGQGRLVVREDDLPEIIARAPLRYRRNPNGSVADIAGVCNEAGNVLGLMPHPERYLIRYHHPGRRDVSPAGLAIFKNAALYLRKGV